MRSRFARRLLLALAYVVTTAFTTAAFAQRYEWRDVSQMVTIQPDGRVVVLDTRTLWTDGQFQEAFICFGLGPGQTVTMLPLTGAVGAGPDSYAYSQPCAAGTELVIRHAKPVSERRMRFAYVFDGSLHYYADVVQWYWNLVQLDHPPIVDYRLEVRAPGPMTDTFDAYVHRYSNPDPGRVWLSDDRSKLVVEFQQVPPGDGVEVRYLMDPAWFDGVGTEPGLEMLLEDEASTQP